MPLPRSGLLIGVLLIVLFSPAGVKSLNGEEDRSQDMECKMKKRYGIRFAVFARERPEYHAQPRRPPSPSCYSPSGTIFPGEIVVVDDLENTELPYFVLGEFCYLLSV